MALADSEGDRTRLEAAALDEKRRSCAEMQGLTGEAMAQEKVEIVRSIYTAHEGGH